MRARNGVFYSIALIAADLAALLIAFTLAYIARVQIDSRPLLNQVYAVDFLVTFLYVAPLFIIVLGSLGLYERTINQKPLTEFVRLFIGSFIGILLVIGYAFVINTPVFPARLVAVYAFVGSFILLVVARRLIHTGRKILLNRGRGIHRLLVIGNSKATKDIIAHLGDTRTSGYHISAVAGPKKIIPASVHASHYASVESALLDLEKLSITSIIQTDLFENSLRNQRILSASQSRHIAYSFIPSEAEFYSGKNTVDVFLGYPMISVSQTPLIGWGEVVKRIFDVVVTALLLIILAVPLLVLILLQKLFNPGPVFYKSRRLSRYSDSFELYKFRSMSPKYGRKDAADEFRDMGRDDLAQEYARRRKVRRDPRITAFGYFLRATSLDELPQFFNVLRGDLSLVGPRPILPQEMKLVKGRSSLLHSVKSGVTGLWQVSGRSDLSFEQRIELETYYAQNWSFWTDIKILLKTIKVVFARRGAK